MERIFRKTPHPLSQRFDSFNISRAVWPAVQKKPAYREGSLTTPTSDDDFQYLAVKHVLENSRGQTAFYRDRRVKILTETESYVLNKISPFNHVEILYELSNIVHGKAIETDLIYHPRRYLTERDLQHLTPQQRDILMANRDAYVPGVSDKNPMVVKNLLELVDKTNTPTSKRLSFPVQTQRLPMIPEAKAVTVLSDIRLSPNIKRSNIPPAANTVTVLSDIKLPHRYQPPIPATHSSTVKLPIATDSYHAEILYELVDIVDGKVVKTDLTDAPMLYLTASDLRHLTPKQRDILMANRDAYVPEMSAVKPKEVRNVLKLVHKPKKTNRMPMILRSKL